VAKAIEIERTAVERAYDRWAPVYDLVFGSVFERGRQASLIAAERIGGRILEVGVGTGISLPDYSSRYRIVGVDISEAMLMKARDRVSQMGLQHVEAIEVMDAEKLNFPDDSFDVVVAQYVVTAVPNPEAALDEFARVLKPGGEIILLSRVGAEQGPRRTVERLVGPVAARLGWRTEFAWARYTNWVARSERVYLIERRPMPPLGHFSLIRFGKHPAGAKAQPRLASAV
jgi:phosphatidylethanolamine/phosphatidyl-N-methylethanolamine N-methyltransferase